MKETKLVSSNTAKGAITGNKTGSALIVSTYLDNEDSERGYLANQESMHTGIRSRTQLNSREVCSTAHKRTKPMETTETAYKKKKNNNTINGACFLSSSI